MLHTRNQSLYKWVKNKIKQHISSGPTKYKKIFVCEQMWAKTAKKNEEHKEQISC